jgi:hypothetical protein
VATIWKFKSSLTTDSALASAVVRDWIAELVLELTER